MAVIVLIICIFIYLTVGEICDYLTEKAKSKGADIDE